MDIRLKKSHGQKMSLLISPDLFITNEMETNNFSPAERSRMPTAAEISEEKTKITWPNVPLT